MVLLAKTDLALLSDEADKSQASKNPASQSVPHIEGAGQTPVAYVPGRLRRLDLGCFRFLHCQSLCH